jgi:integrase
MSKTGRPPKLAGTVFSRRESAFWWVRYPNREGRVIRESTGTTDRDEAERFLRARLDARDDGRLRIVLSGKNLTLNQLADWFLERRSRPPFRSVNTHAQNLNALKHLRPALGDILLSDITPEAIEDYLRGRLKTKKKIQTKLGTRYGDPVKPSTVHQEFRILTRIFNVGIKQKWLAANPCNAVEFPVSVSNSTRKPHYMTASEQTKIEFNAPSYLRNAIVILTETGLRPYKELMPMKKSQVDLDNSVVHISDSKTPSGVGNMPMTVLAREAFKAQMDSTRGSECLFPSPNRKAKKPHITGLRKVWANTLQRAKVPYFPIYHLRHTFATRLSAGGVADHFVTQMLRQGDSRVFKRYSQAKLMMMREALEKLDRKANQHARSSSTAAPY